MIQTAGNFDQLNVMRPAGLRYSGNQRKGSTTDASEGAMQDELSTFNIIFVVTEEEAQKVSAADCQQQSSLLALKLD